MPVYRYANKLDLKNVFNNLIFLISLAFDDIKVRETYETNATVVTTKELNFTISSSVFKICK